ncbi:alpha/beta fold hydrolase [Plastorhodobacter daqingensis]|uniref:Alpha/beta fold hydrolase n=1 Tax=Plastorhodobacter daqingensis TaxID=1387281 RepID=A0ABW2UN08_9RHOB
MLTAVLIPGLISDSRIWRPLATALSSEMALHQPDLAQMTGITTAAEQILADVDGPLLVAGHSMGGRIALEMARIAPDRVRGLILANTGHGPLREGEPAQRQKMIDLGHQDMAALVDLWLPPMVAPARRGDAALMDNLRDMALGANAACHERQIRALMARPDAGQYLAQIRCPVLLVTGREDQWSPIRQHEEIAAAVPETELVVIEDAGHFAPIERPEAVRDAALAWLAQKGLHG